MPWLEISLSVDGELAEAVAEVLARFAPSGVVMEQSVTFNDAEDEGTPIGPVTVKAYLVVDDSLEKRREQLERALYFLGRIRPLPQPRYQMIQDQNWMEAWKAHYQPIEVGQRFLILPAWLEMPATERLPIRIEPGMAFGTGTHPSTQLCLELMETLSPFPQQVIDIGCGSGILSIASVRLGAQQVLGVDIDATALENAQRNAILNQAGSTIVFGQGSVREIAAKKFLLPEAPLVLANILAPVLLRLLDDGLYQIVAPGGTLIVSGILQDQETEIIQRYTAEGLTVTGRKQKGEWVALALLRPYPP
ncbi:MAG: 50S ribosomal protein L11 methyltransferase [Anaerolineales bacterium]